MSIREQIKNQAKVIPNSVKTGSVQQSIRWKEQAIECLRVANNPKAGEHELKMALSTLKRYE